MKVAFLLIMRVLIFLEDADVVDLHYGRKSCFVHALRTAPGTAPGEVQSDVEGLVERPGAYIALAVVLEREELFAVHIRLDLVRSPLERVDVEFALCVLRLDLLGLLGVYRMVIALGVDGR